MDTGRTPLWLCLAGALAVGCGAPSAPGSAAPHATQQPLGRASSATAGSAVNDPLASQSAPPTRASTDGPVATGSAPASAGSGPPAPLPAAEQLLRGVQLLDPYAGSDDEPTRLRFAHATKRGVLVRVGFPPGLTSVEGAKPEPVAVRGVSPPIDIVATVPTEPPADAGGAWEVFAGDEKICEGKLVDFERASYLRNLEGERSMGCQEVAEGMGAPLGAKEIAEHYALMAIFSPDVTARVSGCVAPAKASFLWARPAGSGPQPQNVCSWTADTSPLANELYARTVASPTWRELARWIEQDYADALPGSRVPSRRLVGRRVGGDASLPGWSVWTQAGNTMSWGDKVTPVSETGLWDLYTAEPTTQPWMRVRVKSTLELEMVASGQFGDGVELVAIARSQCHDTWLMLGRQGEALQVRGALRVACWCSD